MLHQMEQFMAKEHLLANGKPVLLAVSGGRDSATMAELFFRSGRPFAMAHCNFHLRTGDCDRDEQFVRQLAARYGVECFVEQFDTLDYASCERLSVEEAARCLRYSYFDRLCVEHGFQAVATAHHRDDATETFFINLLRGTGIAGLHGIRPVASCPGTATGTRLIRPLLCFGRSDIDRFVANEGLAYVEDITNGEPLFLRNRIRLQVMPLLREIDPAVDSVMQANMARLAGAEALYREAVERYRATLIAPVEDGYRIAIAPLMASAAPATVLYEMLRPYGFSSELSSAVFEALDGQPGKQFLSPTYRVVKDRDALFVTPLPNGAEDAVLIESGIETIKTPVALRFSHCARAEVATLAVPATCALFDADKVQFPLSLRHWREGDRFRPFGMNGSQLLSDYFKDKKLSLSQKESAWLLCDADDTILWVVGRRAAATAAVTGATRSVLRIEKMRSDD